MTQNVEMLPFWVCQTLQCSIFDSLGVCCRCFLTHWNFVESIAMFVVYRARICIQHVSLFTNSYRFARFPFRIRNFHLSVVVFVSVSVFLICLRFALRHTGEARTISFPQNCRRKEKPCTETTNQCLNERSSHSHVECRLKRKNKKKNRIWKTFFSVFSAARTYISKENSIERTAGSLNYLSLFYVLKINELRWVWLVLSDFIRNNFF